VQIVGIAQSLGLFFVVCLTTAALLSLAVAALTRMERATLPVSPQGRTPVRPAVAARDSVTERISSPGSCMYNPRDR
jgi:hypothetical protein